MSKKLKTTEKYTYNPIDKQYVFHTEQKFGRNYVFTSDKIDLILKLYSNYDKKSYTMGEIAQRTSTPKKVIEFILGALGKNHDSIPFTDEKLLDEPEDKLVLDLLAAKSFNITQKFERQTWEQTASDAEKWRQFQHGILDPVKNLLSTWKLPAKTKTKAAFKKTDHYDQELVIGCSDWHYGLHAQERYLYNQREWNIEETKKSVALYAEKLVNHIEQSCVDYDRLNILFLGDMIHGLDGFTDKGTKLEASPLREEQFEQAFNSTLAFINRILEVHGNIRIFACPGNHSSFGDYILASMLSVYFKDDDRVEFEFTNKRHITFEIGDNLFLMEHGYAPTTKDRLPSPGKSRETYLNNLFMAKPNQLANSKRFYYCSADQHHSESYEYTNVEGYMFPTLVGGCRYSDNSGYKSRPRQTCLVVDRKDGVSNVQHYYFD